METYRPRSEICFYFFMPLGGSGVPLMMMMSVKTSHINLYSINDGWILIHQAP